MTRVLRLLSIILRPSRWRSTPRDVVGERHADFSWRTQVVDYPTEYSTFWWERDE